MEITRRHPDFLYIKERANGMLPAQVYQRIYQCARSVRSGLILEIGTAHGAATICMALGAKDAGTKVLTVDKLTGGSRKRFGDIDSNITIIKRNFTDFNVEGLVEFHVGDSDRIHNRLDLSEGIGMLMLDADGAIDRDLHLFYDSLVDDAMVVIDDYADYGRVFWKPVESCRIDLKHRLTYRLVEYFKNVGVLHESEVVEDTFFGRISKRAHGREVFSDQNITEIYRSLIHTDARFESAPVRLVQRAVGRVHRMIKSWLG